MIKEFIKNLNQDSDAKFTHSSRTAQSQQSPQQTHNKILKTATKFQYPSILEQSCSLTIRMYGKQRIDNLNCSIFCTSQMKCQPTVFSFFLRSCK
jgi:hypothetical protein